MLARLLEFRNTREGLGPGEGKKGPWEKGREEAMQKKTQVGFGLWVFYDGMGSSKTYASEAGCPSLSGRQTA